MVAANHKPTSKLNLSLSVAYSDSKAEMDMITFDDINGQLGFDPSTRGMSMYDYDFTGVHEYSRLDIKKWDMSLGAEYRLSSTAFLHAGINYIDYDEDAPYLADESGSAYIAMLNLTYWFK